MSNYEPTIPLTPPTTHEPSPPSSSGPTITWRSRRRRRRPSPSSSSSATAAIVTIMGHGVGCCLLLGAACRHRHPHHCHPPSQKIHQRRRPRRIASSSPPPCDPPLPVTVTHSRPLDRPWRRHGPACGVDALPIRRGECRSRLCLPRRGTGPCYLLKDKWISVVGAGRPLIRG